MNNTYYFAFGSNMNIERLKEREINFFAIQPATIKGYKLVFNKKASGKVNQTYANIQKEENSIVEGVLYNIEEESIKKLDRYEGVPNHYLRKEIEVITKQGIINAWIYIANENMIISGKPSKDYLAHLLAGKGLLTENYYRNLCLTETLV